jgi:hypothetical protein
MDTAQVRCPECGKRLLDIEHVEGERFRLLIVCRCKQRLRIELPIAEWLSHTAVPACFDPR